MALKHTKVSAVADDPAADIKPSDWNADHIVDTDGMLLTADLTVPTAPAAGYVTLFGKTVGGRNLPAIIGPSGLDTSLQPFLGRNKVGWWQSVGNATSGPISAVGLFPAQLTGTATLRSVATTNFLSAIRRVGVASAATAASISRATTSVLQFFRGDAVGKGGFYAIFRWACSDAATVANARTFVGFGASSFGNVNPSDLVNCIGVGTDSGDANLSIFHNDGSGVPTKITLGANFPDHTLSVDAYELVLFAAPNSSSVSYQVTRLNTGDTASGTITTDLPVNTTLMLPQFARNNNATALAVSQDIISLYIETDN